MMEYSINYVIISGSTAVRDVASNAPNNSALTLNWQTPEPSNGDILHYVVRVTRHDDDAVLMEGNATSTQFTVTNLSKLSFPS